MNVTNDCEYWKPNEALIANQTWGVPSSEWTNSTLEDAVVPCRMKIDIIATRPPLVKFAAILSLIVNWTSTFFVFVLTCEVIVMRRGFMMSGTDLLGVTFTSLYALPSVRLLLPGAPEFGALIDLVGIIPNVITISICIVAIAVTKLNKSRNHEKGL
ncbi:hypothetical protein CPB86DRAFT_756553 [Serendipita vermifera]|nr:hypothetical protein CPB86DRAFT_756553 [Serendipita vermifera]